jgi:hypothetical protein
MKSTNNFVMRKSDKATHNSYNNKNGQNQVVTSNRYIPGSNGKSSFFGARRATLTTSTNSSGYSPSNKNIVSQKKWNKKSTDESVISASSCTQSNNTNSVTNNGKKLKSLDSVGCGSSQTSGRGSEKTKSTESFDMKDLKHDIKAIEINDNKAAEQNVENLESLQQIQEAKPGNKRALLVDLPPYLYSIPALASFFEPYGEVAMLQILPQKRMWDADLIDLLGASMCNNLANQSLCAVVEFYSARMAKFIIGILRKRLPILKFRCALLKPSAAIELTNQAENLGLNNVVIMKNKPIAKNTISTDSGREASHDSEDHDDSHHHEESGCDSNSNAQRLPSYAEMSEEDDHAPSVEEPTTVNKPEGQRFVTSFSINLGR